MLFIVISIIILLMIVVVYMRKLAPQQEQYIIGEKVEVVSVMDGDTMKVRYNGQIKKCVFYSLIHQKCTTSVLRSSFLQEKHNN